MKRMIRIALVMLPAFGLLALCGGCELKEDEVDPGEGIIKQHHDRNVVEIIIFLRGEFL